jgi:uncharacterized protein (TIGR00290 family)
MKSTFTVIDATENRVPMHAVSVDLVRAQLRSLGVPERFVPLSGSTPDEGMIRLIHDARRERVDSFAFGDLFLDEIRSSREHKMQGTGISTLFPLWQTATKPLVVDLIENGMRAIITSVDFKSLPASYLGQELTVDLVDQLSALGCDPCGENGEYHSFVFDGPQFHAAVDFDLGRPNVGDEFGHLPLLPSNSARG